MSLPTVTFGGQEFLDISGIVSPNRYTRLGTDGAAVHHTVAQQHFETLDQKIEHVKAINQYHLDQGYGGFGYNAIAFDDGTVMTVGNASGARAHVANENNHLVGIAMAGTFSSVSVPLGLRLGVGRFLAAVQKDYGTTEVRGHRQWVTDPAWATECPGDKGVEAIGSMTMVRDAIAANNQKALDEAVRQRISAAILPNAQAADLVALAGQIRFLTGGRLCG